MQHLLFKIIKAATLIAIAFNHVGAVGKEHSVKTSSCPKTLFTLRYLCKAYEFFQTFSERFKVKGKGDRRQTYSLNSLSYCTNPPLGLLKTYVFMKEK